MTPLDPIKEHMKENGWTRVGSLSGERWWRDGVPAGGITLEEAKAETRKERIYMCACGSSRIYRSHRRGIVERLLSRVGVWPYRCHDCNRRWLALG